MNLDNIRYKALYHIIINPFGEVMVSVLVSSEAQVDRIKPKTIQLLFTASPYVA